MGKRIIVLGASFAGLAVALSLRDQLGPQHEVLVLSKTEHFVFLPSLIWVPFALRTAKDISFPLAPLLTRKGIAFRSEAVTRIDAERRWVETSHGVYVYDYLVIATGGRAAYERVPGLGPKDGHTQSIFTLPEAEQAHDAFERYLHRPGPVVVGAVQGASFFAPAYEHLFNFVHQLELRGLREAVSFTYVSPEPFLGHLGWGGFGAAQALTERLFHELNINAITNASVRRVEPGRLHLGDGRVLPFSYCMLAPPLQGIEPVRAVPGLTNGEGFVKVRDTYQSEARPEIFACGQAVAVPAADPTPVPCDVPKNGYLSDKMATAVANNIVADLHGESLQHQQPTDLDLTQILDGGDTGAILSADRFLGQRDHAWLIPGPEAHWAKVAFEKWFMLTHRHGLDHLARAL